MDRLLYVFVLGALLLSMAAGVRIQMEEKAQPAFFSLLFPQLMPDTLWPFSLATDGEAREEAALFGEAVML